MTTLECILLGALLFLALGFWMLWDNLRDARKLLEELVEDGSALHADVATHNARNRATIERLHRTNALWREKVTELMRGFEQQYENDASAGYKKWDAARLRVMTLLTHMDAHERSTENRSTQDA